MINKESGDRFVFEDGSYQDFPNKTDRPCAVVWKGIDITNKKAEDTQLVDKTAEEIAAYTEAALQVLRGEWQDKRMAALTSYALTIFPDTTLSQATQDNILRTRQEWRDMTSHASYPVSFTAPKL